MKKYTAGMTRKAIRELNKMDNPVKVLLFNWINENLDGCSDPRFTGKALSGDLKGLWRYRVGDYRILADIRDEDILILVVSEGHRKEIYR